MEPVIATTPPNVSSASEQRMESFVLDLHDVDQTHVAIVGGKGAHLGELSRIDLSLPKSVGAPASRSTRCELGDG